MVTAVGVLSSSSSASKLSTEKALDDGVVACRRDRVREATGCKSLGRGCIQVFVGTMCQPSSSVVCGRIVLDGGVGGTGGCGWKSGTLGVGVCTLGGVATFVGKGEA